MTCRLCNTWHSSPEQCSRYSNIPCLGMPSASWPCRDPFSSLWTLTTSCIATHSFLSLECTSAALHLFKFHSNFKTQLKALRSQFSFWNHHLFYATYHSLIGREVIYVYVSHPLTVHEYLKQEAHPIASCLFQALQSLMQTGGTPLTAAKPLNINACLWENCREIWRLSNTFGNFLYNFMQIA